MTQAATYATRDTRPLWRSRPGGWLLASSAVGLAIPVGLAATGTLMAPVPVPVILALAVAAVGFCLALDAGKRRMFPWLGLG